MADKYNFSDVFISYARKDSVFVRRIGDALAKQGYEIWADWEDIPQSADWWAEIEAGIDASNIFAFFVSPHSAQSATCFKEVQYAVENNKRIVPILCENIDEDATLEKLHQAIRTHNWLNFDESERSFGENLERLLKTLTMDVEYLRQHTRYLVRAREWNDRQRNTSFLLRGTDASEANIWLKSSYNKDPKPLAIQQEYIQACLEQSQADQVLEQQQRALQFVERRTIPTVVICLFTFWYYGWKVFPVEIYHGIELVGRPLIEITFGVAGTASIILAALALYGDELVLLRYRNNWHLRLGASFAFSLMLGASVSGFLQAMYFGPALDWITVFTGALGFGLSVMLRATFKLRGWQSFIIAFVTLYWVINITYATPDNLWGGGRIPLFFFNTDAEVITLGMPMALSIAFGMYAWPILHEILQVMPESVKENEFIKSLIK